MKPPAKQTVSDERMRLVLQEDLDLAMADAHREGALNERARIQAIVSSQEAKYKYKTAVAIATKSSLSVDDARDLLASLGQGSA